VCCKRNETVDNWRACLFVVVVLFCSFFFLFSTQNVKLLTDLQTAFIERFRIILDQSNLLDATDVDFARKLTFLEKKSKSLSESASGVQLVFVFRHENPSSQF
jgi:hypothetical protein